MPNRWKRPLDPREGSALLVVILFVMIITAAVVPSYLLLSRHSLQLANRVFYDQAALNLAESGIEHGIRALSEAHSGGYPWEDWVVDGDDAFLEIGGFPYQGSTEGSVVVRVSGYQSSQPDIVALARIQLAPEGRVSRMVRASVGSSGRQGFVGRGAVTRGQISAGGGVVFDSWNSNPENQEGVFIPYSVAVSTSNVLVGSVAEELGVVSLGSSDVFGYVGVGGSSEFGVDIGWGGQIGPRDPAEWDPADTTDLWKVGGRKISHSTSALVTDFSFTFEDVSIPGDLNPIQLGMYNLPYTDQREMSNEWSTWYENVYVDTETLGSPGQSTYIELDGGLYISANATLEIAGDVTLLLPEDGLSNLNVTGGGKIVLQEGASLTAFVAGDVLISGAGLLNAGPPENVQIYGVASESQAFDFQGSGSLHGVVYAPKADLFLSGATSLRGALVANELSMSGSGSIYYDEALERLQPPSGSAAAGGGAPAISHVAELTGREMEREFDAIFASLASDGS